MASPQKEASPLFYRKERIVLAASSDGDNKARRSTMLHVRLESSSTSGHHHHPLLSLTQLLHQYQLLNVHVQIGTLSSNSFPTTPLDHNNFVSGPSGLLVRAEFVGQNVDPTRFEQFLQELAGDQRVLLAAVGTSMQRRRLHRVVEQSTSSTTNTTTTTFQTILPLEGSQAVFSNEGLRSFLEQTKSTHGFWSVADASTWSTWMLGGRLPTELKLVEDAGALDPVLHQGVVLAPHKRSLWMDWSASEECYATEQQREDSCQIQSRQSLQYSIVLPAGEEPTLALNDILPHPYSTEEESRHDFLPVDPFADESLIQLLGNLEWRSGLESDISVDGSTKTLTLGQDSQLDFKAPLLSVVDGNTLPKTDVPFWKLHTNLLRSAGQANGGTFEVVVENSHGDCSSDVSLTQTFPAVLKPVWRSTELVLEHEDESFTVLPWNGLRDHQIDFREDGSFKISLQHSIPPASTLRLFLDYEPSFLSIEEFPGDANRGFEIPPAHAIFQVELDGTDVCHRLLEDVTGGAETASSSGGKIHLYSNAQLILAPLPDMSMPFNVISLTCTLYAFVAGSLINLLLKKANNQIKAKLDPSSVEPQGLLGHLKAKIGKLREKWSSKRNTQEDSKTNAEEDGDVGK